MAIKSKGHLKQDGERARDFCLNYPCPWGLMACQADTVTGSTGCRFGEEHMADEKIPRRDFLKGAGAGAAGAALATAGTLPHAPEAEAAPAAAAEPEVWL